MRRRTSTGLLAALTIVLGAWGPAPALAAPTPTPTPTPAAVTPAAPDAAPPTSATPAAPAAQAPRAAVVVTPAPTATATPQAATGEQAIAAKAASDKAVIGAPTGPVQCGLTGGGCRQEFEVATVLWSPSTGAHWTRGAIRGLWNRNAAQDGVLGYPTSDEICGLAGGGCKQHFQNGDAYWSPATNEHFVQSAIGTKWLDNNAESGFLGYPTSDPYCGLKDGGCGQHYQGGLVYWSPTTGAHFVRGAIGGKWAANSWEGGFLGYPTSDEYCGLAGGGCGQHYQHGDIYWSPATNEHFLTGETLAKWNSTGAEAGFLGYPTSDQFCGLTQNGCGQHYQGGEIYWSPSTDAHFVRGAIWGRWTGNGWENGFLGYPTSDEFCGLAGGGCGQHYQGGEIYWSPTTDAHFIRGAIRGTWTSNGSEAGLGYPTSDEFCGLSQNGCGQHFTGGEIYWSPGTGAHFVRGAIRGKWTGNNWENGFLGYPTSDEFCGLVDGGCGQHYQGGEIYWSPGTDAHFVRGAILGVWTGRGWENGRFGYPTSDEICSSANSCASNFQHGTISWTRTGGTAIAWDLHPVVRQTTSADVASTYHAGCPVGPAQLRTIDIDYRDFNGTMQRGQIIVRDSVVNDVIKAFSLANGADYQIRQMTNPNAFGGDDPTQMAADNTSGFNCRAVVGNPYSQSPHSYGTAVDVNDLENPFHDDNGTWWPANGSQYVLGGVLDRPQTNPAVLRTDSALTRAFEASGWFWGGRWVPGRDYQHFQK